MNEKVLLIAALIMGLTGCETLHSVTIKGRIESVDGGNKGCRIELASDPRITKN